MTISDDLRNAASDVMPSKSGRKRPTADSAPVAASAREARDGLRQRLETAESKLEEFEHLEQMLEDGSVVARLDPARVRHSRFANRLDIAYEDSEFQSLVADIRETNGNEVIAKVRPVTDDDDHDYEIVYGHRRHSACKVAGADFRAIIEEVDDTKAIEQAILENSERLSVSAYEEALQYASWVESGIFRSYSDMSEQLGVSLSGLSQRKSILDLPEMVRVALGDPRKVSLRGWRSLQEAYRKDPEGMTEAAEAFGQQAYQEMESSDVQSRLTKLVNGAKTTNAQANKVQQKTLSSPDGSISVEFRTDSAGRVKIASKMGLSESMRTRLEQALADILKGDADQ